LAQSNLNTESSLAANIQLAKLPSSSLNAGGTLVGDAFITRLFAASLNGNGSLFANPLITKFAASSLNANASLAASALLSKLPSSSLTGAGTLAAELTVVGSALLLDTYPNAAAAYSLRKLRTAYAGSAIRVRRSSDNTEQDIGFVDGELDTVSLLAFCGVGNGFVTTWYDQSGNARNATQATAVNQPQIVSNGIINAINSKTIIDFNNKNIISPIPPNETQSTFVAFNNESTTTNHLPFCVCDINRWSGRATLGSNSWTEERFGSPLYYKNGTLVTSTRNELYINFVTSNISLLSLMGGGSGNSNRRVQYPTINSIVKVYECIIYFTVRTSDRNNIETNINNHYAIY